MPPWMPWWEDIEERSTLVEELGEEPPENRRIPSLPDDLVALAEITKVQPNPAAAINFVDLVLSYVWLCRRYDGELANYSTDVCRDLRRCCETVSNPTRTFGSPSEVVATFRSKRIEGEGQLLVSNNLLVLLLHDAECIFRSAECLLAAICDLHRVIRQNILHASATNGDRENARGNGAIVDRRKMLAMERKLWWFCCWIGDLRKKEDGRILIKTLHVGLLKELKLAKDVEEKVRLEAGTAKKARDEVIRRTLRDPVVELT